jgi:hypothetical protein
MAAHGPGMAPRRFPALTLTDWRARAGSTVRRPLRRTVLVFWCVFEITWTRDQKLDVPCRSPTIIRCLQAPQALSTGTRSRPAGCSMLARGLRKLANFASLIRRSPNRRLRFERLALEDAIRKLEAES